MGRPFPIHRELFAHVLVQDALDRAVGDELLQGTVDRGHQCLVALEEAEGVVFRLLGGGTHLQTGVRLQIGFGHGVVHDDAVHLAVVQGLEDHGVGVIGHDLFA